MLVNWLGCLFLCLIRVNFLVCRAIAVISKAQLIEDAGTEVGEIFSIIFCFILVL